MNDFDEKSCGAVIFRQVDGERLYLAVEYKKEKGYWGLVKGHVESGESELETARREIYEETGLADLIFVDGFRVETRYQPTPSVTKLVVFFVGETQTPDINYLWDEHVAHRWLPYDQVGDILTYDTDREIVRQAEAFLAT
jgi:tRNA nucleotidyltransferase (CCA-adding enzyme)